MLNLNIGLSCGNQVMSKKQKSWSHCDQSYLHSYSKYETQVSCLYHLILDWLFQEKNSVKLQQKFDKTTLYHQKYCLMYITTTIYKQVLCIHILYMLNVQTNWQASKSSICFSTSRYTSFQKSKKDRMEFRHLKRNWVKSHQWNKNEKSNS